MEFADLNDEIIADDWLIPSKEITRRKLIKQTPTHNIYKADWFGDVLVYEPISNVAQRRKLESRGNEQSSDLVMFESSRRFLNQEELSQRLSSFSLTKAISKSQLSLTSDNISTSGESTDSAYSSISSTPQYYTNNSKRHKFEFPINKSPSASSFGSSLSLYTDDELEALSPPASPKIDLKIGNELREQKSGTVLNRSSFEFSSFNCGDLKEEEEEKKSTWSELNELRLVAHESFMLFMGASIRKSSECDALLESESTSLVMQMNHPKATSLYNLLHANKIATSSASPIDRFFGHNFKQQPLNVEAKLNICQQVTNAMTYLHDKNIVHGRLTSVNIYIELNQRVKISLIDNSEVAIVSELERKSSTQVESFVQFNLPSLTYLSPELIKTIKLNSKCDNELVKNKPQIQMDTAQLSKKSDIFSFGTLLFELFEERFPFSKPSDGHNSPVNNTPTFAFNNFSPSCTPVGLTTLDSNQWNGNIIASASELIFQIGNGQIESNLNQETERQKSEDLKPVDEIILACWSLEPENRPQFKQLSFA